MLEVRIPSPVQTPPLEPTTPMRASEAMRLGCLLAPVQSFREFGSGERACAVGAMNLGYGLARDDVRGAPWTMLVARAKGHACPVAGCLNDGWIAHLNDDHRWPRERIADWLEGLGL